MSMLAGIGINAMCYGMRCKFPKMDDITKTRFEADCELAKEIAQKVRELTSDRPTDWNLLFVLCLIYVRQLKYHDFEEAEIKKEKEGIKNKWVKND